MVIRMDIKPVVVNEDGTSATAIDAIDGDTSKLLLQGMQVLGTLLPPPPAAAEGATPAPGTALTERQELVILAVTPAQAEVVKWAQNDAQVSMSLVLRSPDDFIDAERQPPDAESPASQSGRLPRRRPDARRRRPSRAPAPRRNRSRRSRARSRRASCSTPLIQQYGVLVVDINGSAIGGLDCRRRRPSRQPTESPAESPAP